MLPAVGLAIVDREDDLPDGRVGRLERGHGVPGVPLGDGLDGAEVLADGVDNGIGHFPLGEPGLGLLPDDFDMHRDQLLFVVGLLEPERGAVVAEHCVFACCGRRKPKPKINLLDFSRGWRLGTVFFCHSPGYRS